MKKNLFLGAALAAIFVTTPALAELKFKPGEDASSHWANYDELKKVDLKGETLTIFGPWRGDDENHVQIVLEYFREATGADVKYSSSENYEQQIVIDTQAGSPPNIAILPQPGLLADLAAKGLLSPLADADKAWIKDNYGAGQSWVDLGTYKDKDGSRKFFAFPYKADLKSLVWYSPENFADAGYEIPKTMEELIALSDKIVADGGKPWCIGLGSGGATGWPATDWVEDIMLRTQPPEVYDKWVTNEIKFDDPAVTGALDDLRLVRQERCLCRWRCGGRCLDRFPRQPQGSLLHAAQVLHAPSGVVHSLLLPGRNQAGRGCGLLLFPALCREARTRQAGARCRHAGHHHQGFEGGARLHRIPEDCRWPMNCGWRQSGFLTPLKSVNHEAYANDALKKQGEILTTATTFRFDGSDLMPGKIGAGAFWTGMVDFVGGKSAADAGAAIQKAWDEIK